MALRCAAVFAVVLLELEVATLQNAAGAATTRAPPVIGSATNATVVVQTPLSASSQLLPVAAGAAPAQAQAAAPTSALTPGPLAAAPENSNVNQAAAARSVQRCQARHTPARQSAAVASPRHLPRTSAPSLRSPAFGDGPVGVANQMLAPGLLSEKGCGPQDAILGVIISDPNRLSEVASDIVTLP
ncbi:hypothetical protein WJX81_004453 [Elliptochloris bilobata]|uniref:Uncharacterized protein n=1 Tax=Elliptochloris bilobata TaxID=381761 RepID=A0AAW1RBI5_9CHLO